MTRPLAFDWDGEVMKPRHPNLADEEYVVGESYVLAPIEQRSMNSHKHFFSMVNDAWQHLPEHLVERFRTSEHLRKWALIKGGYRDERSIVCASKSEAQRLAVFVRPMDDFAVVTVNEATVTVLTAKSQSMRAMGRADFQKSKDAVLDVIAKLIGVETKQLEREIA